MKSYTIKINEWNDRIKITKIPRDYGFSDFRVERFRGKRPGERFDKLTYQARLSRAELIQAFGDEPADYLGL